jgi:signal transduction histidine kinase
MMRTIGVYLLYAAVALRGVVIFANNPRLPVVIAYFGLYGLLLFLAPWITHPKPSAFKQPANQEPSLQKGWKSLLLLFLQSVLVVALMAIPETQDFFALLFIPISMQVVLSFGRKIGYVCIAIFSSFIILMLLGSEDGPVFGLAMGVFFSGLCFLFGSYAYQVQKAEIAHNHNQEQFKELQVVHGQLQGYAAEVGSLALEQERNRLARNLHDSVTQTVFSMNLAAQSARLLLDKEPIRASEQLLHLEELATDALSEIQTIVSQLRPRSVAEEGLPTALRRMVADRREREGLEVSLQISGEKLLSQAEAEGLYSIAYEALTNVIKHSGVLQAAVCLNLDVDGSYLEIEDRGVGFVPNESLEQYGHLGMTCMSEQANEIGWELTIASYRQRGTRICVSEKPFGGSE